MRKSTGMTRAAAVILSVAVTMSGSGMSLLAETAPASGSESAETEASAKVVQEETVEEVAAEEATEATESTSEAESGEAAESAEEETVGNETSDQQEGKADSVESDETEKSEGTVSTGEAEEKSETTESSDEMLMLGSAASDGVETELVEEAEETVLTDAEETDESKTDSEETLEIQKLNTHAASDKISLEIKDATLRTGLAEIYKATTSSPVTGDAMTFGQLRELTVIDFTKSSTLTSATTAIDLTGLGYAENVVTLNLNVGCVKKIPQGMLAANEKLTTLTLPTGLLGIGSNAFTNCINLEHINAGGALDELPTGLGSKASADMGESAFQGCEKLTQITIPGEIGGGLQDATSIFQGCKGLTTVTIESGVTVLPVSFLRNAGDPAANGGNGMSVTFGTNSKLEKILSDSFRMANIKSIDLSNISNLTLIGAGAFAGVDSVSKDNLTGKEEDVQCKVSLESIILPATQTGMLEIQEDAFLRSDLTTLNAKNDSRAGDGKVVLPDYVRVVGRAAFYKTKTTGVVLSANLLSISEYAFAECESLSQVSVSDKKINTATKSIENEAFCDTIITDGSFVEKLTVLERIGTCVGSNAYELKDGKTLLETVIADGGHRQYYDRMQNKDFKNCRGNVFPISLVTLKLPATLRQVGTAACCNLINLKNVTWATAGSYSANQVFKLEDAAFANCTKLQSFQIPKVTRADAYMNIGHLEFAYDSDLTSITDTAGQNHLPDMMAELGTWAFAYCDSLASINVNDSTYRGNRGKEEETGIVYPIIQPAAFGFSGIQTASIPACLTEIPGGLFYDSGIASLPSFKNSAHADVAGSQIKIEKIGDGAFFGNTIDTLDLSAWGQLYNIGIVAFAYYDDQTKYKPTNVNQWESRHRGDTRLVKVILPDTPGSKGEGVMAFGHGAFDCARLLTTFGRKSKITNGVVTIPTYMRSNSIGANLFNATSVSKAVWEYCEQTNPSEDVIWTKIRGRMFSNCRLVNFTDAVPSRRGDIIEIEEYAYAGNLLMKKVDLRDCINLEKTQKAVFSNCMNVEEVVFPKEGSKYTTISEDLFHMGYFGEWAGGTELYWSSIKSIDFGGVETIGKNAFATYSSKGDNDKGFGADVTWPSNLGTLNLQNSKVKKVEEGAFRGNCGAESYISNREVDKNEGRAKAGQTNAADVMFRGLTSIAFNTVLTDIGDRVFQDCRSLKMSNSPLPDSLVTIGQYAFSGCTAIEGVKFGSGITTIGSNAFRECAQIHELSPKEMEENKGLTTLDFSRAGKLTLIGDSAFEATALKTVDTQQTQLRVLNSNVFKNCPYLTTVKLNMSLKKINDNAAAGCVHLMDFWMGAQTILKKDAFSSSGDYEHESKTTSAGKPIKCTPIGDMTVHVMTPELNVGIGKAMVMPYYLIPSNDETKAQKFATIIIRDAASTQTTEAYREYLKITAMTDGYYWGNSVAGHEITDGKYYVAGQTANASDKDTYVISKVDNGSNGTEDVVTFRIEGLKDSGDKKLELQVVSNFLLNSNENQNIKKPITAVYDLKIRDIQFYPVIFEKSRAYTNENSNRTDRFLDPDPKTGIGTKNVVMNLTREKNDGNMTFFYDLVPMVNTTWVPEEMDLVIKSNNPAIIYPTTSNDSNNDKVATANLKAENNLDTVSMATNRKEFSLKGLTVGTASVEIYPKLFPSRKTTLSIKVRSDVRDISLSIPKDFETGFQPGDKFNLIEKIDFYQDMKVTREDNNLTSYSTYSDNAITFTSDHPELFAVDNFGNVTVGAITTEKKEVTITADAKLSDGTYKTVEKKFNVGYPEMSNGREAIDRSTGSIYRVKEAAANGKPAQVVFTGAKEGQTVVVIGDTFKMNGVDCQVVEIDGNAFKNNETIKSVVVGTGVTEIHGRLFEGCKNLESVEFKGKIKEIPDELFKECAKLNKVVLPKTVQKIGRSAFEGCKSLTTITLPANLKEIPDSGFKNCKKLKKIVIPKKVTVINANAFNGCAKLASVTYQKGSKLQKIEDNAFAGCKVLKKMSIISKKLTKIGSGAFSKCKKFALLTLKSAKVTEVGNDAFKGISKKAKIKVPAKKVSAYKELFANKGQGAKVKIQK